MPNFDLRLFNMPAERLFNPRKRLRGIPISIKIIRLVPFKEELLEKLNEGTDCIQLLEFFNGFGLNNVDDLKEFPTQN